MTTAQVPARPARPAPRPVREAPARPPLRIVRAGELTPRARRRRNRAIVGATGALVVIGLFGLVAFHVMVTQAQFRLDRINGRVSQDEARYQRLRLQVAELESPDRIIAAAQERLGMVPPPGVTYLSATGAATDPLPANGGGVGVMSSSSTSRALSQSPPDGTAGSDEPVTGGWSEVKSELAAGR